MKGRGGRACTVACLAMMAFVWAGCRKAPLTDLTRLIEARRLAAQMLVEFTKSVDAGNRAVMADTDDPLRPTRARLRRRPTPSCATRMRSGRSCTSCRTRRKLTARAFNRRLSEFRGLDQSILDLAVENTNLKAQRLSFGPVREAADAFRDALDALTPAARTEQAWHIQALTATSVTAVREIQMLQAPHIAESDDAAMTRIEKRAAEAEAVARRSLETLASLVGPDGKPRLAVATAALDRFMALNGEVETLSRRNSNVRSLALSLGQKRTLSAACDDSLRELQNALATRTFGGSR